MNWYIIKIWERELNLNIKIVGKNIELGESFQAYSSARIGEVLNKYSYDAVSTQITLEKRIGNFKAKLKVYLKNKIELDATGRGKDANTSYEDALDHIEKKLRRYHRRMKSHRNIENKNILSHKIYACFFILATYLRPEVLQFSII